MARTRGGLGARRGDTERQRPTASTRRRCGGGSKHGADTNIEEQYIIDDMVVEETHPDEIGEDTHVSGDGFPGGPVDTTLLKSYTDHVARHVWDGEDRGELKLVSHGRKLSKFGLPHDQILPMMP